MCAALSLGLVFTLRSIAWVEVEVCPYHVTRLGMGIINYYLSIRKREREEFRTMHKVDTPVPGHRSVSMSNM